MIPINFILVIIFIIILSLYVQSGKIEGLRLSPSKKGAKSTSGESSGSDNYITSLNSAIVTLQDELLVTKYKNKYDDILVKTDDYINMLMLKHFLNLNLVDKASDANMENFENISLLQKAKESLNDVVTFVENTK